MPKVVVYIPAAKWRELSERGDPALWVRSLVKDALEFPGEPPVYEVPAPLTRSGISQEPPAPISAEDFSSAAPAAENFFRPDPK